MQVRITILVFLLAHVAACKDTSSTMPTTFAMAHPLFKQHYTCMEHWAGNLPELGDALGADCVIQEMVESDGRVWMRSYLGDGAQNEDWFGWHKDVLSPCSCVVVAVRDNPSVNKPGVLGKPPAASVILRQADGTYFALAHLAEIGVKLGDAVRAGQVLARVGNNGYSRHPHVHIGAWREEKPLQVRFDLEAMGKLFE